MVKGTAVVSSLRAIGAVVVDLSLRVGLGFHSSVGCHCIGSEASGIKAVVGVSVLLVPRR